MIDLKTYNNYNSNFSQYHKSTKKYVLVFNRWTNKIKAKSITEYNTLKEAQEEINLINEIYKDTPKPKENCNEKEQFEGETSYWGYILIDFEHENITIGNDGIYFPYRIDKTCLRKKNKLLIQDYFFRKENEIPKEYKWDGIEEYEGWLRFRWGDGKNSIEYVDILKSKKKKDMNNKTNQQNIEDDIKEEYDEIVDKFDNELARHMIEAKGYKW